MSIICQVLCRNAGKIMGLHRIYVNKAQKVENELPNGFGFVVLAFSFNTEPNTSQMMYVSNADRQDIVKAMKEWIDKTEKTYGNDTNKY